MKTQEEIKKEIEEKQAAYDAQIGSATKARAVASANVYGLRFFEVRLSNEEKPYLATLKISLSELKDRDIAKTLNSFKKVNAWLEKPETLKELKERLKQKYRGA